MSETKDLQLLSQGSSETWERTGSMRSGLLFQRPQPELRTSAIASSFWPTATAGDAASACNQTANRREGSDHHDGTTLPALWMTPNVPNGGRMPAEGSMSSTGEKLDGRKGQVDLGYQASLWATPCGTDHKRGEKMTESQANRERGQPKILNYEASQWATPAAGGGGSVSRSGDRIDEPLLAGMAQQWSTPTSQDFKGGIPEDERTTTQGRLATDTAEEWTSSPQDQALDLTRLLKTCLHSSKPIPIEDIKSFLQNLLNGRRDSESSKTDLKSHRPRLNPNFTEWLMNLPPGFVTNGLVDLNNYARWEMAVMSHVRQLLS